MSFNYDLLLTLATVLLNMHRINQAKGFTSVLLLIGRWFRENISLKAFSCRSRRTAERTMHTCTCTSCVYRRYDSSFENKKNPSDTNKPSFEDNKPSFEDNKLSFEDIDRYMSSTNRMLRERSMFIRSSTGATAVICQTWFSLFSASYLLG